MSAIRNEVHDFVRAAETLLSPASLNTPLTKDECKIVEFYAASLMELYRPMAGDGEQS